MSVFTSKKCRVTHIKRSKKIERNKRICLDKRLGHLYKANARFGWINTLVN